MNLDFSEFHDIEHSIFSKECRESHGGWRTHLSYAWMFRWRTRVRRQTLCRIGLHQWTLWYTQGQPHNTHCFDCQKSAPPAIHKAEMVAERNRIAEDTKNGIPFPPMIGDPSEMNWDA